MPERDRDASARPSTEEPPLTRWEQVSFTLTHAGLSLLLRLLGLRGLYLLGRAFGTCEWMINFKRRRRFDRVLRRVIGDKPRLGERLKRSREHFMCTRCDKLFYLIFDRIPPERAEHLLAIENHAKLDEAIARRRGVYVALAHQAGIHAVGMLLCMRGCKVAAVRDRREGGLRRFIQHRFDVKYPQFTRTRILFADSYPREIFRCFADEFLLGSAMDVSRVRHPNQKTEEVTVFGERQFFLSGPMRAALRCRAPIVQAFLIPEKNFHYRMQVVEWLLDPEKVDDEDSQIAEAMRRYAANVEAFLRDNPSLVTRV